MKHQTHPSAEEAAPSPIPVGLPPAVDNATIELLKGWRLQDATANPSELRAADCELAEFKDAMNSIRAQAGEPPLYP